MTGNTKLIETAAKAARVDLKRARPIILAYQHALANALKDGDELVRIPHVGRFVRCVINCFGEKMFAYRFRATQTVRRSVRTHSMKSEIKGEFK
jgi:hypothetical protein